MKKTKRILALLGVVILLGLYVFTLITALLKSPLADGLFMSSLFCTIIVPVLLYMYMMIYKYLKNRNSVEELKTKLQQGNPPKIKNIVFDVGNVLVDFSWRDLLVDRFHFDEKTCKELTDAMFLNTMWNEFDRSNISDEELFQKFYDAYPHLKTQIQMVFDHIEDTITTKPYTLSWIQELKKKGYRVYVLSNYAKYTYHRTQKALKFQELMDGCIWSFEHQVIKPEPAIYKILLDTYQLDPTECLFLDDKQENLDAAKKFGMKTILFKDQKDALKKMKTFDIQ